jgi:AP-1 complex subunit gamma-1
MGDEPASPSAPASSAASTVIPSTSATHDLLADIFGSTSSPSPSSAQQQPPAAASGPPRSAVDDIMGLFGPSNPTSTPSAPSASSLLSQQQPAPSQQQQQQQPRATAPPSAGAPTPYTAYEKNGLKVTLTPRASPTQAGVIQILAKFTSLDGGVIKNVNFQAAVPRVRYFSSPLSPPRLFRSFSHLTNVSSPLLTSPSSFSLSFLLPFV